MTRWHCCTRPKAEGNSASGHPQHRGCAVLTVAPKGHSEIVVLLPNSELTKGNNKKHDAGARADGRPWRMGSLNSQ